ncbi:hypothetical protein C0J52_22652, partial [Blattella germanica]
GGRTEDGLLLNRDRKQKQRVWFLHRDVSVNILTQGGLQIKKQSIDCIGSLKLMKCQNQRNHCSIPFSINTKNKGHIWPSHGPDINPCDCFLWEFLKEPVFRQHPGDLLELRVGIVQVCNTIDEDL